MKALSVRQPWAELIVQGKKTLELRSWTVKYRGPLVIHASQTIERAACLEHGISPDGVTTGAVIGVVDLVMVERLDEGSFAARRSEHLAGESFMTSPLYGWRLENPRPIDPPLVMRGRMGLFEAPVGDSGEPTQGRPVEQTPPRRTNSLMARLAQGAERIRAEVEARRTFELRVLPEAAPNEAQAPYRLALHQRQVEPPAGQRTLYDEQPPAMGRAPMGRVAELGGVALRAVAGEIIEALRTNGYKPTELSISRREPFALSEETGVRLGLLFLAVRPLSKVDRIEAISLGIRSMTSEELYYWYSKCVAGPTAERAQRALRVLLAGD
jgi:hypothetical protein